MRRLTMKKAQLLIFIQMLLLLFLTGCGLFQTQPVDLTNLENALQNRTNFMVHYYYEDNEYYYETDYRYQENIFSYTYETETDTITEYFAYDEEDDLDYYYYQDQFGKWKKSSSETSIYQEAEDYLDYLDLSTIVTENYTMSLGDYVPKAEFLQQEAKGVFGNWDQEGATEEYSYFRIKVTNQRIEKIYAESVYEDQDGAVTYTYVLTFSNWGLVDIDLPEIIEDTNHDKMPISIPSTGTVKALVVPVNFTNYTFTSTELQDLNKAFNGTSAQTGWESVSTFYQKSSYQTLDLEFTLLPAFQTGHHSSYYETMFNDGGYPEDDIMADVLAQYDSTIDFSTYDADENGEVDAIYLIYAAPTDYENDSLWWAWVTYFFEETPTTYDGTRINYYMWAGVDFMYEVLNDKGTETTYDDVYVSVNATTYIHESGHLLGLDDYYDYVLEQGPTGGLGGADMMDEAVGDHNPASKYLLGWIEPTVVAATTSQTIQSYGVDGDALIIYKNEESPFSEYIVIVYYKPDGLNAMLKGTGGLFTQAGLIFYHVDARMDPLVGDPNNEDYDTPFSFNNSTSVHKFIKIIEADGDNSIEDTTYTEYGEYASNDDLFQLNDILMNYHWYDETTIGYTIQVTSLTATEATLSFTKN